MKKHPHRIEATFNDALWALLEELELTYGSKRAAIRVAIARLSKTEKAQ